MGDVSSHAWPAVKTIKTKQNDSVLIGVKTILNIVIQLIMSAKGNDISVYVGWRQ